MPEDTSAKRKNMMRACTWQGNKSQLQGAPTGQIQDNLNATVIQNSDELQTIVTNNKERKKGGEGRRI